MSSLFALSKFADQIDEENNVNLKAANLVSPEILEQTILPDLLFTSANTLKKRSLVHLVVVDESHTIETWTAER